MFSISWVKKLIDNPISLEIYDKHPITEANAIFDKYVKLEMEKRKRNFDKKIIVKPSEYALKMSLKRKPNLQPKEMPSDKDENPLESNEEVEELEDEVYYKFNSESDTLEKLTLKNVSYEPLNFDPKILEKIKSKSLEEYEKKREYCYKITTTSKYNQYLGDMNDSKILSLFFKS